MQMATIEQLWVRPTTDVGTRAVDQAMVRAGAGVDGDHFSGDGSRQITLIDRDSWDAACQALGADVDPALRRANVLVEGVVLGDSIGRTLQLGRVRVRVIGETTPCSLMDEMHPGLLSALVPACRGGVYGEILDDGSIRIGDDVKLLDTASGDA